MSAFQSMIVINHAKHLLRKNGVASASKYLAKNGVDILVCMALVGVTK